MMHIKIIATNPLQMNSYVLSDDSKECVIIDPGYYFEEDFSKLRLHLRENNLTPKAILCTHLHFDHVLGMKEIQDEFNIPSYGHEDGVFLFEYNVEHAQEMNVEVISMSEKLDHFMSEGDTFTIGSHKLEVLHVPGHCPGHLVFYERGEGVLFTGDVLFKGFIGRTDLIGGDHDLLLSGIKGKLWNLPDTTRVYSGHGLDTTIGSEKKHNPFVH